MGHENQISLPSRRILAQLSDGDASVSELAIGSGMSLPGFQKHLKVLSAAKLISEEKDGRVRKCHFEPGTMSLASEFIGRYQKFWETQFGALEKYLAELDGDGKKGKKQE